MVGFCLRLNKVDANGGQSLGEGFAYSDNNIYGGVLLDQSIA